MSAVSISHIPDLNDVLDLVLTRPRITYYDHITDNFRTGIDIRGLSGDTTDVTRTNVILSDSLIEWEIPLMRLAEMRSRGTLRKYRPEDRD